MARKEWLVDRMWGPRWEATRSRGGSSELGPQLGLEWWGGAERRDADRWIHSPRGNGWVGVRELTRKHLTGECCLNGAHGGPWGVQNPGLGLESQGPESTLPHVRQAGDAKLAVLW